MLVCVALCGYVLLCILGVVLHGSVQLCVALRGSLRLCPCGSVWPYKAVDGSARM